MDRRHVQQWIADYERLWRTPGTDSLHEIFTEDATYQPSPWARPVEGLAALAAFWEGERDGPNEGFTMTAEVVAVEGTSAVVRASVDYETDGRWRNLWVLELADDGRCRRFEEWPFAPAQPDGHG